MIKGSKRDVCEQLFKSIMNNDDTTTVEVMIEDEIKRVSFVVPKIEGSTLQKRTYARMKADEMYSSVSHLA